MDEKPWPEVPCDLHRLAKLLTSTILAIPVGRYLIALHQATGGERLRGCRALQGEYLDGVLFGVRLDSAPTGAASIVYTAPATSTTANAVYAAGSTSAFAATQRLFPL